MSIVNTIPFRDLMIVSVVGQTTTQTIFNAESPRLKVLDAWCVKTAGAGAGDTVTIDDGTTAITDAMDCNVADKLIVRAASIDDATAVLEEGGTLRAVFASAAPADVFVLCQLLH